MEKQYCPITGEICVKEPIKIIPNSIFLAEPFDEVQEHREIAIKAALNNKYQIIFVAEELENINLTCKICYDIKKSTYGIVDLTNRNPNVMFELGLLIGNHKPVILLEKIQENQKPDIPSDIRGLLYISYLNPIELIEKIPKVMDRFQDKETMEKEENNLQNLIVKAIEDYKVELAERYEIEKEKKLSDINLLNNLPSPNTGISNKDNYLNDKARLLLPDGPWYIVNKLNHFGRENLSNHINSEKLIYISRNHFEVKMENEKYFIKDISRNGTKVNEKKIPYGKWIELKNNSIISLAEIIDIMFINPNEKSDMIKNNKKRISNKEVSTQVY